MALSESVRKQITDHLASNRTVLFMKGTPRNPQCGFSAQVVLILDELLPSYETVDVLRSPEIRDGIKEFSMGSRSSPSGRRFPSCTSADSSSGAATSSAK